MAATITDPPEATTPGDDSTVAVTHAAPAPEPGRRSRLAARRSGILLTIERKVGLTPTGLGVLGLVIVGYVLGRMLNSRPVYVMTYGLLLVLVISWLLGRRNLDVDANRSEMRTRVRQGQTIEVELSLTARRRISTIVLEEELHHELGVPVRVPVPLLPSGEEVRHAYTFVPSRRGIFKVGPLVAEWSDPFGLTRRRMVIAEPADLIVHPSTQRAHDRVISREWEDPPIRPPVSRPWPTGFEFYGMRDYVDGDDPRRIVWRASARTDRILVRESEQGITDQVNLFLDTDSEFHSPGSERSETFETAVDTVASLAIKHLKDGFSVNLDKCSGRMLESMRGQRNQLDTLDALAAVEREQIPLTKMLERLLVDPRRSAHNVIITPHLEVSAATRLRLLLERGTSLLLVLIMWEDTEPATLHRAGSLGCPVVEVSANVPLDRQFQRVLAMGRK